jgi:hypothetical protein
LVMKAAWWRPWWISIVILSIEGSLASGA